MGGGEKMKENEEAVTEDNSRQTTLREFVEFD